MNVKKPFKQGALIVMVLALILYLPTEVHPGTTGKIAGRLVDAQTGDPLPGANVVVQGTTLGAATDLDGYYAILRVPPGAYTLEITMIGYKKIIHTNVIVNIDLTATQNFSLEATVIEGAEITTTARRPLVIKDLTSSSSHVTASEIEDIPNVRSVTDAIILMPGVIGEGEDIHIRGGRSGEAVYMIDGIAVNDPLFNNEVIEVNKYAIEEVELLTGGYNAEYGMVQSGIVNIVPRTGRSHYSGRIAYFTDNFGSGDFAADVLNGENQFIHPQEFFEGGAGSGLRASSFHADRVEFNLGGPVPLLGDKLRFFVSGTADREDGWLPNEDQSAQLTTYDELFEPGPEVETAGEADATTFANPRKVDHPFTRNVLGLFDWGGRFDNNLSYSGALTYRATANMRVNLSFVGSQFWRDSYDHDLLYIPNRTTQFEGDNSNLVFTWTHSVNSNTFYEVKLGQTKNFRFQYAGIRNGIRATPEFQNNRIEGMLGIDPFFIADGDGDDTNYDDNFFAANPQFESLRPIISDFARAGWNGANDEWSRHNTRIYTVKADVVSQLNRHHQVKVGFEWRANRLTQQRIDSPENKVPSRRLNPPDDGPFITSGAIRDFYTREPNTGSVYIQDKIEFESLIVNLGLRFDNFDPGAQVFEIQGENPDPDTPEDEVVNDKKYLSPRIGLSHPITDRTTLYFFYGRFVQIPSLTDLYRRQNRFRINQDQLNTFGNPDLAAEETISYEVGFDHQLSDNLKIGVTGFFKDTRDQINLATFGPEADPFRQLVNRDFGSDRGFEIEIIKRHSNYFSANINYTLLWANTRSSTFSRNNGDQDIRAFPNLKEVPADWDQRHTVNANISFQIPQGEGINVLGANVDRLSLNTFIRYGSGQPFTIDADADPSALENSARLPYFLTVDLRFRKDFGLFAGLVGSFYVDVFNLFNRRNVLFLGAPGDDVNHECVQCVIPILDAAGEVIGAELKTFENGNPAGDGSARALNPEQFGDPRQILLGFAVRF